MPAYDYTCPACNKASTVIKPMAQATAPEYCDCNGTGSLLERVYEASAVKVAGGTPKFHARSGGKR